MGRLTLNILLSFAQFEREIIGERIRDKIAAQRRKGKWAGGHPVLGYDVDRSTPNSKLVINAKEAIQVREMFDFYLRLESLSPVIEVLSLSRLADLHYRTAKAEGEIQVLQSRMRDLESSRLAEDEVRTAFGDFESMWSALTMREQVKIVKVLVQRVEYDPSDTSVSVSFHPAVTGSLNRQLIPNSSTQ